MLITQHADVPGMIGKVGTILGNAKVNISTMQVSRNEIGRQRDHGASASIDKPVEQEVIDELRRVAGISSVRSLTL